MSDVLIRDLPDDVLAGIDAHAAAVGLSTPASSPTARCVFGAAPRVARSGRLWSRRAQAAIPGGLRQPDIERRHSLGGGRLRREQHAAVR